MIVFTSFFFAYARQGVGGEGRKGDRVNPIPPRVLTLRPRVDGLCTIYAYYVEFYENQDLCNVMHNSRICMLIWALGGLGFQDSGSGGLRVRGFGLWGP